MKKKLHNYQFDFIKIKTKRINAESVNWDMLDKHPTIKNAYTLDSRSELFSKNFKLYINKSDQVFLETSVPYLLYGHNYIGLTGDDLKKTFLSLQDLLGIDFINAEVLEFEYGCFAKMEIEAKDYIKSIVGVRESDLKFSNSHMKMYGQKDVNFKIYDAVSNAKYKKTFALGNYPDGKLIKYEVKVKNANKKFAAPLLLKYLCRPEISQTIRKSLHSHISCISELTTVMHHNNSATSLNEILFLALKHLQDRFEYSIYDKVLTIVDLLDLTPSQKSKRRKSLMALEQKFKLTNSN